MSQWPLTEDKLQALEQLVKEQLEKGHIIESNSPWNTPVFVIKKKSGKWRLLQDLRAVNAVMKDMGPLQPGLPSPVAVPQGWKVVVIDLQDCFFSISLHPDDCEHFAFSVPSINYQQPYKRYQWVTLPQGMKNSPTLCQKFVAQALEHVRQQYPKAYIIHYMDDILLALPNQGDLDCLLHDTIQQLTRFGLVIAPDKVQKDPPFNYLGHVLTPQAISSQKLTIRRDKLKTLNDFQKLLGDINWLRPYLKITTGMLSPLYNILHGESDPKSLRSMTPEAVQALHLVEQALSQARVKQLDYHKEWELLIFPTKYTPTACLWQNGVLEWLHLPHTQAKMLADFPYLCSLLIIKGRVRSKELFGKEPYTIVTPYKKDQVDHLLQNNDDWLLALEGFIGQVGYHYPKHPIIEFAKSVELICSLYYTPSPIAQALVVFTDGSSKGRAAVYTVTHGAYWKDIPQASAQQAEINAVILAFETFPQPFNLYTDSKYVANLFPAIETALLSGKSPILPLLQQLQMVIQQRKEKFYIGHIRGHSGLPGPLAHGNAMADLLTQAPIIGSVSEAQSSHALHHQNARALKLMFHLTREQARQIIKRCQHCPQIPPVLKMGVNPRGLKPNVIWQMDVTHVSSFGKLCYVHVTIDTFSHFVHATARTGEAVKDVIQHLIQCFQVMGKPSQIKTDNGPAYISKAFSLFCQQWHIQHITGIPYNPQGQAIIERAHQMLKVQLQKLQQANKYFTPHHILSHSLFTLNHLNITEQNTSAAERHWKVEGDKSPLPQVLWKDLLSGQWKGPDVLITSGRGYACVFPQDADSPIWIPDRLIRPAPVKAKETPYTETKQRPKTTDEKDEANVTSSGESDLDENPASHQRSETAIA